MKNIFCERFKELREENNLSFEKLGKELGISSTTLCRWENNKSGINGENLIALAKYFKVSTDYLLGLED